MLRWIDMYYNQLPHQHFKNMDLHSLGVLGLKLSDNIRYLVIFPCKLAKHKMAAKMWRKVRILYGLLHNLFMVSGRCVLKQIIPDFYFTFKSKTSDFFL